MQICCWSTLSNIILIYQLQNNLVVYLLHGMHQSTIDQSLLSHKLEYNSRFLIFRMLLITQTMLRMLLIIQTIFRMMLIIQTKTRSVVETLQSLTYKVCSIFLTKFVTFVLFILILIMGMSPLHSRHLASML